MSSEPATRLTARRSALVTGASYGIGAATAIALARDGYDVAVTELNADALGDTLAQIKAHGGRGVPVALDTYSQDSVEACMHNVLKSFGTLDLLVNNAGVLLRKPVIDMTRDEWNTVIDVNLTGTFFMTQQMGRHLIATKRKGNVISIASTASAPKPMWRDWRVIWQVPRRSTLPGKRYWSMGGLRPISLSYFPAVSSRQECGKYRWGTSSLRHFQLMVSFSI